MQDEFASKTKRKQEMHELQALGVALVALSESQLQDMSLETRLHEAVLAARRITSHEARRRQMQYIGRLMRDADAEPIRARLAAIQRENGTWRGDHCITSTTFCTAASLITLAIEPRAVGRAS